MKNILFVMLIFTFSITANSQTDNTSPQIGVKGGLNLSTLTGDDIDDLDSRTSFNVGLFMELPLSNRFSIQPELLYSGQGFTILSRNQSDIFDNDENVEYQLSYIQVPVMAKIYLIKGLNVEIGPQFGFKLSEKIDTNPASSGGETEINPDDSYVKNFDTSLALGAGYKFDSGFFISARYTQGLSNIFKENTILQNVDARNAVWQFGVGFSF